MNHQYGGWGSQGHSIRMTGKKIQSYNNNLRSLWDTIKCKNIRVIGVPEEKQDVEELFEEIMVENIPHLVKEIDIQPKEAQRVPSNRNSKRPTPRHIIIKMPKFKYKEKLKSNKKKAVSYLQGSTLRLACRSEGLETKYLT